MAFKLHVSHLSLTQADESASPATFRARVERTRAERPGPAPSDSRERPAQPTVNVDATQRLPVPVREVLSRDEFLLELVREKRRADRAKAPLSIVHWHWDSGDPDPQSTNELLEVLCSSCRQTDAVGDSGAGILAVLLPNTNRDGATTFIHKIRNRLDDPRLSSTISTYPDDAFDGIANGQGIRDEASLFAEEASSSRSIEDPAKRAIDVALSLLLILALAPVMLATALAVALTSRGPVIFRQSRLGRGGVPFDFYKFRSMRPSNDDRIHREFVSSLIQGKHGEINQQSPGDPLFKIKNDPRVTPVGRFIRSTSIDELPQLFNVLKGDMSLVGPRPPLAYEAEQYQSWHLRRILEVRPGITGLWQVEGRSRVSFDEMVRMDLRYIKQRSLALDFKLLFKTVAVVLARQGAK